MKYSLYLSLLTLFLGCAENASHKPFRCPISDFQGMKIREGRAVLTTDYVRAGELVIEGEGGPFRERVHFDSFLRKFDSNGLLFVINRGGASSLQWVDPRNGKTVAEVGMERDSNLQDVWLEGENLYISRHNSSKLALMNSQNCKIEQEFELKGISDADGVPEMTRFSKVGEHLVLILQKLNKRDPDLLPAENGALLWWKPGTKNFQEFKLGGKNPTSEVRSEGEDYFVAYTGRLKELDGGIERITGFPPQSKGMVVTERNLGGDLIDFWIEGDLITAAVFTGKRSRVVQYSISKKSVVYSQEADGYRWVQVFKDPVIGLTVVDREQGLFGFLTRRTFSDFRLPPSYALWMR